ncbi:MAG: TolB family protein [Planctomycetota bacterium]
MALPSYTPRTRLAAAVALVAVAGFVFFSAARAEDAPGGEAPVAEPTPPRACAPLPGEKRLTNIRQLTFGGENAEAYWSFDEKRLVFQSTRGDWPVDQIYVMGRDGRDLERVSTGTGRTTCAYFLPGDERILFASTHADSPEPPKVPDYDRRKLGYVWPLFSSYDIYTAKADGTDIRPLVQNPGYDAEATVSPTGDRIVFTSTRDGDIELYSMAIDGSDVKRLTHEPGYDGGAFFSWDGKHIVWRAPDRDHLDVESYRELLARQLVKPSQLEIWIMAADGSGKRMITRNGAANFAPFWHPDGRHVIYASNVHDPKGANFELYFVDIETLETERVTWFERSRPGAYRSDDFDGFPMFTRDGKTLVWCSNRHNDKANETNVFVADWVAALPGDDAGTPEK